MPETAVYEKWFQIEFKNWFKEESAGILFTFFVIKYTKIIGSNKEELSIWVNWLRNDLKTR